MPPAVVTAIRPEAVAPGTVKERLLVLEMIAVAATPLSFAVVADGVTSKLLPVTATEVPATPDAGVKLVMTGAPGIVTVKSSALVAVFPATVTVIRPLVAPSGTLVLIEPVSEALAAAAFPLNVTALLAAVALKPAPYIVTAVPTGPLVGVKLVIAKPDAA
jgi:hypothetical protein